ncbi:hypothetical protein [Flavobacterium lipolyticum]|uniref:Uncharacterized protein n=1 Tax=Flavobacterium lipolyticum TaxID=2893754 RepID=A0ABS8LUW7_9FLAO|nr:hypothetical protein [Flavobacterium sp. F-126]MCC9016363.1 hypothetical protein [Flavobacterium sp. F-126]
MDTLKSQEKVTKKAFLKKFETLAPVVLKTMPDEEVYLRNKALRKLEIRNMIYDFCIDSKNFISEISSSYDNAPVEEKKKLDYFKIYFIQDDNDRFSICFSISSVETEKFGDKDFFFKIKAKKIEKIEKEDFIKYSNNYKNKLLQTINTQTRIGGLQIKNTEAVSYKLKDLYFFILKHFLNNSKPESSYSELFFEMIKFEETNEEPTNQNKLSIVVRAQSVSKGKAQAYDFGRVYP